MADNFEIVHAVLGELRREIAQRLRLMKEREFRFVWVVDFPLFEWDETENRIVAVHHPFTHPHLDDLEILEVSL